MRYLIDLKNDLIHYFDEVTADKVSLMLVNGELLGSSYSVSYIARFILIDCKLPDPFHVLTFIRTWFADRAMTVPDLNFDCDVIDLESYDLQIDIGLSDKLNIADDGQYTICPNLVWSDAVGAFISSSIAAGAHE